MPSADDWVAVDLEADGDRTGGNGLELTDTDETGQLRGKIATPTALGVVRVDSTICNADGVLEARSPSAELQGGLNIAAQMVARTLSPQPLMRATPTPAFPAAQSPALGAVGRL